MLRWPIRLKLIVGLSLVVGMMLILMGASIFGLHSFHLSYLTLVDQMREIGASGALMGSAVPLRAPRSNSPEEIEDLKRQVIVAQNALEKYFKQLKKNANQGNRVDSGTDELGLAFLIDDDLTAILNELDRSRPPSKPLLPGTEYYVEHHPELLPQVKPATDLPSRIERLNETVMQLPKRLYEDFWAVLQIEASVVQSGEALLLPNAAANLAAAEWQRANELAIEIETPAGAIRGTVPIGGLSAALQTLKSRCPIQ